MSEKPDTEHEVNKSGDDEAEKPTEEEIDTSGKEIVDKSGDETVIKTRDAEVDESSDNEEESHRVKLPPLVKSDSAKYSDKTVSSKNNAGSLYLKSPKYSVWGRSNVDSVLTDYGYTPGNTPSPLQKPEKQERRSTGKKSFSFDGSDVVKDKDTRESRKQYYLKIYEDIHKLRDYCREEYFEKLEEKVGKQRKNMKKKNVLLIDHSGGPPLRPGQEGVESKMLKVLPLPKIRRIIEPRERLSSVQLMMNWLQDIENLANKKPVQKTKPRPPPQSQKHYYVSKIFRKPKRDVFLARNYLKNVPKSEHYKIIQLEDKLRAEGKLKTQADVDDFWCTIRRPEVYKKYFLVTEPKTLPHEPTSQVPITMVATLSNPMHQVAVAQPPPSIKPMGKILDYWQTPTVVNMREKAGHVTTLGKRIKSPVQPAVTTIKKEDDPFHRARKAAAELDQKHPQMSIPHLNCFHMDFEEQQRDPEEALQERRSIRHSKERLLFVKRLHRMYSLANANLASTQRILEKRKETELVPFPAGCSVVSDLIPEQAFYSAPEMRVAESHESRPWLKYIERKREITSIQEVSEGGMAERVTTPPSAKSDKDGPPVARVTTAPATRNKAHIPPHVRASMSTGKLYRGTSGERSVRVHVQDTVPICWESLVEDKDVKVLGSKTPNFYWFNYLGAGQKSTLIP